MRVSRYPVERNFMHPRHEQFTADFDVAGHLDRWSAADRNGGAQTKSPSVSLQVNGPGGGQWQLQLDGERLRVERGLPAEVGAGYYMSATTFAALAGGKLSVDESINSGLLVVNTAGERIERLVDVLEQVVSSGAGAPRATHVMN